MVREGRLAGAGGVGWVAVAQLGRKVQATSGCVQSDSGLITHSHLNVYTSSIVINM